MDSGSNVLWRSCPPYVLLADEWAGPMFRIPIPGAAMREASSVADLGIWYAIADCWAQIVSELLPHGPAHVLDIGCSCAKVGRLLSYNPNVTFLGLDVFKPSIEWCQRAFAKNQRFTFRHLDVFSSLYNPSGKVMSHHVELPVASASIDVVIAGSLFTHLTGPDFNRYLSEVSRCLKPTGTAVVSLHLSEAGSELTGDETRIELGLSDFEQRAARAGLQISQDFGNVFGQRVYALIKMLHT